MLRFQALRAADPPARGLPVLRCGASSLERVPASAVALAALLAYSSTLIGSAQGRETRTPKGIIGGYHAWYPMNWKWGAEQNRAISVAFDLEAATAVVTRKRMPADADTLSHHSLVRMTAASGATDASVVQP